MPRAGEFAKDHKKGRPQSGRPSRRLQGTTEGQKQDFNKSSVFS